MAGFGNLAVLLAAVAAGWSLLAALAAARTGRADLARAARGGLLGAALALTAAAAALFGLLLAKDFSVEYVAGHTSRATSVLYTLGAFWAGQQGSLLLWAWLAALCAVAVLRPWRRHGTQLVPGAPAQAAPYLIATLAAVVLLFSGLVAGTANPFDTMPVRLADGQGLNPLLQNYGQLVHPVTLYLGFVALTVPFAYLVAGLAGPRRDDWWLPAAQRWTVLSWIALTAGIVLGMRWAYVELGWGGYWAWDPVENASLLPWLTATALLHTVPMQRFRGLFRTVNPALVAGTFALSLLGTFLTRSGVVSSVHAFGASGLGPFLLGGILVTVLVSGALIVWRLPGLRSRTRVGSLATTEGTVLAGALLLTALTAVVLWGTLFPLVNRAADGTTVSVGQGYYAAVVTPLALGLVLLVGVWPLFAHRGAGGSRTGPVTAGAAALGTLVVLAATAGTGRLALLVAAPLAVLVVVTTALRLNRSRRDRAGRGPQRGRLGAGLAHVGVAVLVAAIALHMSYQRHGNADLTVGQSATAAGYRFTLADVREFTSATAPGVEAILTVADPATGTVLATIGTAQIATANGQPVAEVGIDWTLARDVYVALSSADPDRGTASIEVYVNPGVLWVWFGAALLLLGALIAAWPRRNRVRPPDPSTVDSGSVGAGPPEPEPAPRPSTVEV